MAAGIVTELVKQYAHPRTDGPEWFRPSSHVIAAIPTGESPLECQPASLGDAESVGHDGGLEAMTTRSTHKRILIVEHDEAMTATYARMLSLEGYDVRTALSSAAGLREIESNPPDAIIADLHMPDIDGLEFLRRVRVGKHTRHTPVAIVTGDYFVDDTIAAQFRELGAEVRFKPLWLEELVTLVQGLLTDTRFK